MRGRRLTMTVVTAALAATVAACGGGEEASPIATSEPTTDASEPDDTGGSETTSGRLPDVDLPGSGFAWQVDGGVLLTDTDGEQIDRLDGWTLDPDRSTRLAAPVVVDPDGDAAVVTSGGLVAASGPLPMADGAVLEIGEGRVVLTGEDGAELATLALEDPGALWVSAVGDVVGIVGGAHVDVTLPGPFEAVEPGCRTADRHVRNAPLLVCDDGARIAGGTDVPAPDGMRWTWVTVGTSGEEFLATAEDDTGGSAVYVGTRSEGVGEPVVSVADGGGRGIFYRSSGRAWLARYGDDAALLDRTPAGNVSDLAPVPGATGVAIWLR